MRDAPTLAIFNSPWEILVIVFIALLLFGKRLPGVARNLGRGITEFKKGLSEPQSGDKSLPEGDEPPRAAPPPPPQKTDIDKTSV
jgi:sec-independent protein translocase protein TatA